MIDTLYCIVDSRTDKRVSVAAFLTRGGAESQILEWRQRDALGMRPDCHEFMPFLSVSEIRFPLDISVDNETLCKTNK